jgi:FKBP-type peptidyl-prolyl cis-trans isomerase FklB
MRGLKNDYFSIYFPRKGTEMKRRMLATVGTLAIVLIASGCTAEEKKPELKTLKEKVSYGIGLSIGKDLKRQDIDVDLDLVKRGLKDALTGAQPLLTDEQMKSTMEEFKKDMTAKQQAKLKDLGEKNQKEGEAFLAENAKKEGVVTLPSGLQYKILKKGTGKAPSADDTVTVNYRGTLVNGTEFDSSYKRGQPATFPVKGVIPGWTEALPLMHEGAKWELYIPAKLAYGDRNVSPEIGPNSTLIFEVELIKVGAEEKPQSKTGEK